jgi:hypothetical protein
MGRRLIVGPVLFLTFLGCAGCASLQGPRPDELAPAVSKLVLEIQLLLVMPENGPIPDDRLLEEAYRERPEIEHFLHGLPVLIKHNRKDVVILVCSPDGKYAWIEDASWTTFIDRPWYTIKPPHPAQFTLDPDSVSGSPHQ